jgi:hypothetical protein
MTYVQRNVHTEHVALLQQRLKVDILGPFLVLGVELLPVVVPDLHAKGTGLVGDVAADAAHAQDPEDLVTRIVTEIRCRVAAPFTLAGGDHGGREVPQRAEKKEQCDVGRGVVHGGGGVGDADLTGGARVDVDGVVASSCTYKGE